MAVTSPTARALATAPRTQPPRIQVHDLSPLLEGGRYPVKRTLGDPIAVECDLVRDGHEVLRAVVRRRRPGERTAGETPMHQLSLDRWRAELPADALGVHRLEVEAWVDVFASWRSELERKLGAGQRDLESELLEGAALLEAAIGRLKGPDRGLARGALEALG